MIRLAFTEELAGHLNQLLLDGSLQENGTFCLVRQGQGHRGIRLLATEALTPPPDAWECQENAMLRPSARFVSAAVSRAITSGAGLMFVHSHPDPRFPVELSQVDLSSFQSLAATLAPMLDGPFAAAVVHPHGWAGVIWQDSQVTAIDRILEIGRTIRFLSPISYMNTSPLDDRQADALGIVHDIVRKLSVGVVGVGGLGSPIAEQLFRMGVDELFVIDHDLLDTESNVRRDFGAKLSDLGKNKLKVDVVGDHLDEIGLGVKVRRIAGDVREEEVFRHLLDADVVLNATDTHGSRAIVNELANTYLLPVIDVGVRVGAKSDNRLSALVAEVRVLTPSTPCLWCRGTISPEVIRAENLPYEERERLKAEGYVVQGVGDPVPSVVALTVLGSGLATTALLSLLSEEGDVAPSGYIVDGFLGDSLVIGPGEPKADCRCRRQLGLGDSSPPPFVLIR